MCQLVQAKLAAQIKKIARRRNAFDDLDDDEAVGNGAQVDDDDHEDEAVQVVEAHEVGLEDDGALAIDATPSKNPFDELSDEEGNEDDSPAGSARPDSPDDQPTVRLCCEATYMSVMFTTFFRKCAAWQHVHQF